MHFQMFVAALTDSTTIAEEKIYTSTDNYLKTNLLQPLNQIIETNLRLQTHLHLQLPTSNPFQNLPPFTFKKLLPACLKRNYINIVQEIEHYLSTMFYNLVTVVLHDWRTYGEMRRLVSIVCIEICIIFIIFQISPFAVQFKHCRRQFANADLRTRTRCFRNYAKHSYFCWKVFIQFEQSSVCRGLEQQQTFKHYKYLPCSQLHPDAWYRNYEYDGTPIIIFICLRIT